MDRSGLMIGGIFGASVAVVALTVLIIPPFELRPEPAGGIVEAQAPSPAPAQAPAEPSYIDLSLVRIFEISEPGVVQIEVRRPPQLASPGGGVGSGFVYDTLGHVITNAHVVRAAERISVTFLDGRSYEAQLVGADADTDLAVLRVEASRSVLHPLTVASSSGLKIGEPVAAIGNPFGLSGSMTSGIVSQMGRLLPQSSGFSIPDVIQTDAAINPGNSGGPLLNMQGHVVGINTAIQSTTGEFTGIGFAVPSDTLRKIAPVLISEGAYEHPWIGVRGADIGPEYASVLGLADARGFVILDVVPGSPAFKAGLEGASETVTREGREFRVGGDIILSVDGMDVRKIDDILIRLQRDKEVGDTMTLGVLRDGRSVSMDVLLEGRPSQ